MKVTPNPPPVAVVEFQAASDVPAVKDPPPVTPAKAPKAVPAGILVKAIANCAAVVPNTPAVHVKPLKVSD